ncbi:hypothetical protein AVEN_137101-1 [Araneus ventricosus]|uniref:Uncharacterized protein n=1 Tax=Araneus ventricosus TaxID=182803 RepID=A0A4Y2PXH0_ARAVE|nr:hypothetical protein AVEN_150303-1 [Araneus ventricosus]GBN55270.1 hypothetical protein AVEN_137101-1 [Araneus ventricosus]
MLSRVRGSQTDELIVAQRQIFHCFLFHFFSCYSLAGCTFFDSPLLWRQIGYGLEALFMVSSDLKIRISKRFAFFAASQGRSKFMKGDGCGNPDQSETR